MRVINSLKQVAPSFRSIVVDVTHRSSVEWQRELSPIHMGPVELNLHLVFPQLPRFPRSLENAWQFSKVYQSHLDRDGNPSPAYLSWAADGFDDLKVRDIGIKKYLEPQYVLHVEENSKELEKLDCIEARRRVYAPLYAKCVMRTRGYHELMMLCQNNKLQDIYLLDTDIPDWATGKSIPEVWKDPRKMSHAFILLRLLEIERSSL